MSEIIPVLILDLDNTIVGNVAYQSIAHSICQCIKNNGFKIPNCEKTISEAYKKRHLLVRPYFTDFINIIRGLIPDIKIFVYTASEKKWAMKEISWIERHCNISFDRPIFTRSDCIIKNNRYHKSINHILPKLKKATKNRFDPSQLLIIDNSNVFLDHKQSFIQCPNYDYTLFDDLWRFVPRDALKNDDVNRCINKNIADGYINPISTHILDAVGKLDLKHKYYEWCVSNCLRINQSNKSHSQDTFWLRISNAIQRSNTTSLQKIKKILTNV